MATKRKTKPSKAAKETAAELLRVPDLLRTMAAQLELQAVQLDQMDAAMKQLYVHVTGKPFPANVLTEPTPAPRNSLLTEPAPTGEALADEFPNEPKGNVP
jgi:hypothetical protein